MSRGAVLPTHHHQHHSPSSSTATYYHQHHDLSHNNMLKVVGASWLKTRISTMILAGSLLLAFGSLYFIVMERTVQSGTYCATVFWSPKSHYRAEFWGQKNNLSLVQRGVARACYSDSTMTNGWSQIEIETNPAFSDSKQAYAAGMLEGALTYASIYNHWTNTIETYCEADADTEAFCEWLRDFLDATVANARERADRLAATDRFWHQIQLYFRQLDGLYAGWQTGIERSFGDAELEPVDLVLLNAAADMPEMRVYYQHFVRENRTDEAADGSDAYEAPVPHASMLLKFLCERQAQAPVQSANRTDSNAIPLSDDLRPRAVLAGHSSDGSYAQMLRMLKHYKFHYRRQFADGAHDADANNADDDSTARHHPREVAATSVQFTGYPGALASNDDFYMATGNHSKLTVAGIRMHNRNVAMWQHVNVSHSVLLSARVMAATRLAHSGYGWARLMSGHAGFGSKQWMVVDVARLHDVASASSGDGDNANGRSAIVLNTRVSTRSFERDEITTDEQDDTINPLSLAGSPSHAWREHLVWIVDQLPGRLHAEDVTARILGGGGFWTGNGVPYFNETRAVGGIVSGDDEDGTLTRSNQWLAGHANIERLADVARALRSRAYRGDLMAVETRGAEEKAQDEEQTTRAAAAAAAFGNIDLKLYAEASDGSFTFRAFAGPLFYTTTATTAAAAATTATTGATASTMTTAQPAATAATAPVQDGEIGEIDEHRLDEIDVYAERRPVRDDMRATAMLRSKRGPFRWSQMDEHTGVGHSGQPDVFDFEPVSPQWAWTLAARRQQELVN